MAKKIRDQRATDEERIPDGGTGKLDADTSPRVMNRRQGDGRGESIEQAEQRLRRERDDAIAKLRDLGLAPAMDDDPREVGTTALDEGDAAQATERMDMSLATRERLAERINRLTAALERIHEGTYGICAGCGEAIAPARLDVIPDATACVSCQETNERTGRTGYAA